MSRQKLYKHLLGTMFLKKEVWSLTEAEFNTMNKDRRKAYKYYRAQRLLTLFEDNEQS